MPPLSVPSGCLGWSMLEHPCAPRPARPVGQWGEPGVPKPGRGFVLVTGQGARWVLWGSGKAWCGGRSADRGSLWLQHYCSNRAVPSLVNRAGGVRAGPQEQARCLVSAALAQALCFHSLSQTFSEMTSSRLQPICIFSVPQCFAFINGASHPACGRWALPWAGCSWG